MQARRNRKGGLGLLFTTLCFLALLGTSVTQDSTTTPESVLAKEINDLAASASAVLGSGPVREEQTTRRLLQQMPTGVLPFGVALKGPHFVFRNVLNLRPEDLNNAVVGRINPDDPTGANDLPLYAVDSITLGNTPDWIVVNLADNVHIENERVFVKFYNSGDTTKPVSPRIQSENRVYQYGLSSASNVFTFGLVLSIVYMSLACCCWFFGVKQFYHLIKIPQMLYMIDLLASKPKSQLIYNYLEAFRYNLFNIIPNPVMIQEVEGVECQPAIEFFSEELSCHSYNTLKNYVLAFIIYFILFCFVKVNKFHEINYWNNLKDAFKIKVFMLAILPDVLIATFLNAVGGPYNSVMSLGFLFSVVLLIWYGYIFSSVLFLWSKKDEEIVSFLGHYTFSRSNLYVSDSKLGMKVLAVMLENVKILIVTMMIALFNNAPKPQMVIVFLAYLLHAIFLLVFRPYNGLAHNVIFAVSDLCFFILVVMIFAVHLKFEDMSASFKEDSIGAGQAVMYFLILFLNLVVFILPVLKGQDSREIKPQNSETNMVQEDEEHHRRSGASTPISRPKFKMEGDDKHDAVQVVKSKGGDQSDIQKLPSNKGPARDIHTADGPKSKLLLMQNLILRLFQILTMRRTLSIRSPPRTLSPRSSSFSPRTRTQ